MIYIIETEHYYYSTEKNVQCSCKLCTKSLYRRYVCVILCIFKMYNVRMRVKRRVITLLLTLLMKLECVKILLLNVVCFVTRHFDFVALERFFPSQVLRYCKLQQMRGVEISKISSYLHHHAYHVLGEKMFGELGRRDRVGIAQCFKTKSNPPLKLS